MPVPPMFRVCSRYTLTLLTVAAASCTTDESLGVSFPDESVALTIASGTRDQILVGESAAVAATVYNGRGQFVPGIPVILASSDTNVIRIDLARIRAIRIGHAWVTARTENAADSVQMTVTVR